MTGRGVPGEGKRRASGTRTESFTKARSEASVSLIAPVNTLPVRKGLMENGNNIPHRPGSELYSRRVLLVCRPLLRQAHGHGACACQSATSRGSCVPQSLWCVRIKTSTRDCPTGSLRVEEDTRSPSARARRRCSRQRGKPPEIGTGDWWRQAEKKYT